MTNSLMDTIRRVAGATIDLFRAEYEHQQPPILRWDWQPGVGLYGLMRAYEVLRDRAILEYVTQYIDRLLEEEIVSYSINGAIVFASVLKLYEQHGDPRYLQEVRYFLRWLLRSAPRCRNGCYEHSWTDVTVRLTDQVWVDTLFMAGIVLAEGARVMGREDYRAELVQQYVAHQRSLQDPHTGLFRHLYDVRAGSFMAGVFWGRGNGWMAASAVEVLEACGPQTEALQPIAGSLQRLMSAIGPLQTDEGMFHTILDDPSTYCEMSATAALGYAALKGVRLGVLDESLIDLGERSLQASLAHIEPSGIVSQVSAETSGFIARAEYNTIPTKPRLYGQALTLLLLSEALRRTQPI